MNTTFQCHALSPDAGVEITGVDLRQTIDDAGKAELRNLFDRHQLLLFRNQGIDPEDQVRVLAIFGLVCAEHAGGAKHSYVSNVRPDGLLGTRALPFHCDFSFTRFQPQVLSLYGADIQGEPEPTMYVNCARVSERLPEALRLKLEGMTTMQVYDYTGNTEENSCHGRVRLLELPEMPPYATHPKATFPVIRRHPRTGLPVLVVSQFHTSHIEGLGSDESEALVQDLFRRLYSPENTYAHHWKQGDLVIWDNIAVQHGRAEFQGAAKAAHRTLCRVAVGEKSIKEIMEGVNYLPTSIFKFAADETGRQHGAPARAGSP